jgi:hypothetical protein
MVAAASHQHLAMQKVNIALQKKLVALAVVNGAEIPLLQLLLPLLLPLLLQDLHRPEMLWSIAQTQLLIFKKKLSQVPKALSLGATAAGQSRDSAASVPRHHSISQVVA